MSHFVVSLVSFEEFLDCMERVVASRVGAGTPTTEVVTGERWRRQLCGDVDVSGPVAERILAVIIANVADAPNPKAVHEAFRRIRSKAIYVLESAR